MELLYEAQNCLGQWQYRYPSLTKHRQLESAHGSIACVIKTKNYCRKVDVLVGDWKPWSSAYFDIAQATQRFSTTSKNLSMALEISRKNASESV